MILMGDEYGHTKKGNNNTWCHDDSLNWFSWDQAESDQSGLRRFYTFCMQYRRQHKLLCSQRFVDDNGNLCLC